MPDGQRGEASFAKPCRREGMAQSFYCSRSKAFLKVGTKRLARDTAAKAGRFNNYPACTTWLVRDNRLGLPHVAQAAE